MKTNFNNSGSYVNYADGRNSSCSNAVVFSSANEMSLSSILKNNTFVPEAITQSSTLETRLSVSKASR